MIKFRLLPATPFRLTGRPVEEAYVFLDTTNPEAQTEVQYEGPEQLLKEIKFELIGSYGMRGRRIEDHTTGWDLNVAMSSPGMSAFEPELVDGQEFLRTD